jgi:hypothetical protein
LDSAYPVEAVLAEKTQTILVRGQLSTRAKDIEEMVDARESP